MNLLGYFRNIIEERRRQTELGWKRQYLARLISPKYPVSDNKRNIDYVANNIANRLDVDDLLKVGPEDVVAILEAREHAIKAEPIGLTVGGCYKTGHPLLSLGKGTTIRVRLLLEALDSEGFREEVGRNLEADAVDPYTEHGGLIVFDERGNLKLHKLESEKAKEKNQTMLIVTLSPKIVLKSHTWLVFTTTLNRTTLLVDLVMKMEKALDKNYRDLGSLMMLFSKECQITDSAPTIMEETICLSLFGLE